MNKKGEVGVGMIVFIAVAVIIGITFLVEIGSTQNIMTNAQGVTGETFDLSSCYTGGLQVDESLTACNQTLTNIPSGWQVGDSAYNVFSVSIGNTTSGGLTLTSGTDYNLFGGTGIIQYLNTTDTEDMDSTNTSSVDYSFYNTGYNKDAGARGISRTFTLFFALIILGIAIIGVKNWIQK